MKHVTTQEIVLYTGEMGMSAVERHKIEEHLQQCEQCTIEYKRVQSELNDMSKSNAMECQEYLQQVQAYLDGNLNVEESNRIEQHLHVCEKCQTIHQWVKDTPSWDVLGAESIQIPVRSRKKIETAVLNSVRQGSKIQKKVTDYLHDLTLVFQPIRPAFVFRGGTEEDLRVIEHPGGDLCLRTGLKNTMIELTSIFEEFTLKEETDEEGVVIFKNVGEGDYVVNVKDYILVEIKKKK